MTSDTNLENMVKEKKGIATSVPSISLTSNKNVVEDEEVEEEEVITILSHWYQRMSWMWRWIINKKFYIYELLDCYLILLGKSFEDDDNGGRSY